MGSHLPPSSSRPTHTRDSSQGGANGERMHGTPTRKDGHTREKAVQDPGLKDYVCTPSLLGISQDDVG